MNTKSAAISIVKKNDHILLVKRLDVPVWVLPGGGVDSEESPENAAIRETFEETGLIIGIIRKTAEYTPINKLSELTHVFEARVVGGVLTSGSESREVQFFPISDLPKSLFFVHQLWLKDSEHFPETTVKRPLNEVTYLSVFTYFLRHPWQVLRFILTRIKTSPLFRASKDNHSPPQ